MGGGLMEISFPVLARFVFPGRLRNSVLKGQLTCARKHSQSNQRYGTQEKSTTKKKNKC